MSDDRPALHIEPLGPANVAALVGLFDACGCACFCRWFHFEGDKNEWLEVVALRPEENRAFLERAVAEGAAGPRGLVAKDDDGRAIGWLKLASREGAGKVYTQRYYRGLSAATAPAPRTGHLSCALVHPHARRRAVLTRLVEAAVEVAPAWGFDALEAFPRSTHDVTLADDELYTLPAALLLRAGFHVVEGDEPYPVVRRLVVRR